MADSDQPARRRRHFLRTGSVLGAGWIAGTHVPAGAREEIEAVPAWMGEQGGPILNPPYGRPSPFEGHVIRRAVGGHATATASWSLTPLGDLHGIITPSGLVFERHHAGVPNIDPARHRLMLHGLVRRPLVFGMDDLVRFPSVSRIHFLECSGNGSAAWRAPAGRTIQQTHGLLACCEWTGVLLSTVLEEAGVDPRARWILAEGADAAAMTRSIPVAKALDDALLVYAQNGEGLRPEQGYPLRLLLPGYEGNMSVKWLRRLEVGDQPFHTREETSKYTDLMPDGTARQFTFEMEAKSVITFPAAGHTLRAPGFHGITGLAWTGRGRVSRVDVSVDGGREWREATLEPPILDRALTRFRLPWIWDGASATLQSRAVDETGYVQPTLEQLVAVRGLRSHYHNNSIQSWRVTATGQVVNAHA